MPSENDQIDRLSVKFDELRNDVHSEVGTLSNLVHELKGAVENGLIHSAPCNHLEEYKKEMRAQIKDLHNRIDNHKDECHSSRSVSANWGLIFTAICSLATLGTLIYMIKG